MRILALDTALPAVSVCVLDDAASWPIASESRPMERGHAEALMPLMAGVMAKVEGGFASLDRVAVTVGPGSFTGIRIGVAAARGIALACGIPVVGVSTLAAFAAPRLDDDKEGVLAATIDARHGQLYFAAYGPGGRVLASPRILPLSDICRLLGRGHIRAIGSGAPILREAMAASGVEIEIVGSAPAPDILSVARLGLAADPENAPSRPLYLKAPDVKAKFNPAANPAPPPMIA